MQAFVGSVPKKVRKRPPKVAGSLSVQSGPAVVGQSWALPVGEVSRGLIWWPSHPSINEDNGPSRVRGPSNAMGLPTCQPAATLASKLQL